LSQLAALSYIPAAADWDNPRSGRNAKEIRPVIKTGLNCFKKLFSPAIMPCGSCAKSKRSASCPNSQRFRIFQPLRIGTIRAPAETQKKSGRSCDRPELFSGTICASNYAVCFLRKIRRVLAPKGSSSNAPAAVGSLRFGLQRRYPIWGWPGRLTLGQAHASKLVAFRLRKKSFATGKA
jgi:hypothetical protein